MNARQLFKKFNIKPTAVPGVMKLLQFLATNPQVMAAINSASMGESITKDGEVRRTIKEELKQMREGAKDE